MTKGRDTVSKNLIVQKACNLGHVRVLDVGCFSGAMLNRIRNDVPDTIRERVEFVGVDVDGEALKLGRKKYQDLLLLSGEANSGFENLDSFDIIIMSNIIHEAIPEKNETDQETEEAVLLIVNNATRVLNSEGNLVILDGLRPEDDQELVTVGFSGNELADLFEFFANKYQAFPIQTARLPENRFQTRIKDLAAFLTKARYLGEDYWDIESRQNYQFFTARQYVRTLDACGMEVERFEPQIFDQKYLKNIIAKIEPKVAMPVKNVLVVAKKKG